MLYIKRIYGVQLIDFCVKEIFMYHDIHGITGLDWHQNVEYMQSSYIGNQVIITKLI